MTMFVMSSGEGFEDYCLRTFKTMLHGEMFPYSLRETYHLVFDSWNEAVNEINEYGVEGYSYMESPDADDYLLSMCGFTRHVVMQDKSLQLLALFCDTTYRQQMTIFDIPVRFTTRCEKMANGKMGIVQIPIKDHLPKSPDARNDGFMSCCGDLYAKTCFDKFLQESGFTQSTAAVAASYGIPEEGLLCILNQNGIIKENDEDAGWELAEALKDSELIREKTGTDGMPEKQWTYKGQYYIWTLLTQNCSVRPCCDKIIHQEK